MKINLILIVILSMLIVGLVFGVVYLNNPDIFNNKSGDKAKSQPQVITYEYRVLSGEIEHTYEVNGTVISQMPELYLKERVIEYVNDTDLLMLRKKGDTVCSGDIICKLKEDEIPVEFNAQIVDIKYHSEDGTRFAVVSLLDYDELFVVVNVSEDKIDKITYETKSRVWVNGQAHNSEIINIGYEVEGNSVPVCVDPPVNVRPGTEVKVVFSLDVQTAALYVSADAIYQDGEFYYANVKTSAGTVQKKVSVGQFFSVEEDGNVFEYVEILSGVSKNDTLIVEKTDDAGSKLKESFDNE